MRVRFGLFRALFGGMALALAVAATASGYASQVAETVEVSGPAGVAACGTPTTVSAVIQELGGALIEGQSVDWSFASGNLAGDILGDTTSTTGANGVASIQVTFSCSPHSVTIAALADEIEGTVVVNVSGEGLPRTDTAPSSSLFGIALAALAVLVGCGAILRRMALGRR